MYNVYNLSYERPNFWQTLYIILAGEGSKAWTYNQEALIFKLSIHIHTPTDLENLWI